MIIIFFGSVINELVKPLHYTVFKGDTVSLWTNGWINGQMDGWMD